MITRILGGILVVLCVWYVALLIKDNHNRKL